MLAGRRVKITLCGVVAALACVVVVGVGEGVVCFTLNLCCSAEHIIAKLLEYVTLSLSLACLFELNCRWVALRNGCNTIHPARKAECKESEYGDNVSVHSIVAGMCMLLFPRGVLVPMGRC